MTSPTLAALENPSGECRFSATTYFRELTMTKAIQISAHGGPEVMKLVDIELAPPAAGEVRIRQKAIGLNFIDIYQRKGVYPLPLPTGLGHEAAGVVEAVGAGVDQFKPGDRVAYMNAGLGAYADYRNVAADRLVAIPDGVSDEQAAAFERLAGEQLAEVKMACIQAEGY